MEIFIQILNVIPLLARIDIPNRLAFKKKTFYFLTIFAKNYDVNPYQKCEN